MHTFEEKLLRLRLDHRVEYLEVLDSYDSSDLHAFPSVLRECNSFGITPRKLAMWASVSPQTIRRWMDGKTCASRYDQVGLVEDIKDELKRQISKVRDTLARSDKLKQTSAG